MIHRVDTRRKMMAAFQLIYASRAAEEIDRNSLLDILSVSRDRNSQVGVTGALLYDQQTFIQVLEGEERAVEETFQRIANDSRHTDVIVISRFHIPSRQFANWSMGFCYANQCAAPFDEVNAFFKSEEYLEGITEGRARKILEGFQNGRWRLS
jgi:hypothetical protein